MITDVLRIAKGEVGGWQLFQIKKIIFWTKHVLYAHEMLQSAMVTSIIERSSCKQLQSLHANMNQTTEICNYG